MRNNFTYSSGFTLVELLVVISVIGIIVGVALASMYSSRSKGADASIKSSLNSARLQTELWFDSNNHDYTGVCGTDANSVNSAGVKSIFSNIDSARVAGGFTGNSGVVNVNNVSSGGYNKVTCHAEQLVNGANGWAVEAPLKASASGAPVMYCVDYLGFSGIVNTNLNVRDEICG